MAEPSVRPAPRGAARDDGTCAAVHSRFGGEGGVLEELFVAWDAIAGLGIGARLRGLASRP